ncbi:MAG: A/G-specific adenine glycosylase [Bacteroidales bacterium]|nr:A/G-specific adenine glycosylase [Bacteroidales bacterium]
MIEIATILNDWYHKNKRILPWRNTKNPYYIWVSEIILQQTRVEQGLPYYKKFIENFPNIRSLAEADEKDVLNVWKGLGYYRRALNMHQAAKYIISECDSVFPSTFNDLLKLKGVGEYTAAAIASIAFGEKTPVVDGNVVRVLCRLYELKGNKNNISFRHQLVDIVKPAMDYVKPDILNQAIMELGALICLPQNPKCFDCPIAQYCKAFVNRTIDQYPIVKQKSKQQILYFNYIIVIEKQALYMNFRNKDAIWKNMYEFPGIVSNRLFSLEELKQHSDYKLWFENTLEFLKETNNYKHVLSHRIIYAKAFIFRKVNPNYKINFKRISIKELKKIPMPRLIEKILNDYQELFTESD